MTAFGVGLQPGPLRPEHFGEGSRLRRKNISILFCYWGWYITSYSLIFLLEKARQMQEQTTKVKNIQMCHKTEHGDRRFSSIKSGLFLWAVGKMSFVFLCDRKDAARSQDNEQGCKWRLIFSVSPEYSIKQVMPEILHWGPGSQQARSVTQIKEFMSHRSRLNRWSTLSLFKYDATNRIADKGEIALRHCCPA